MSLINDALKRANQSKPPEPAPGLNAPPLRPTETSETQSGPPSWVLFLFPVVLLLVCGIAGVLIYQGWHGSDKATPLPGGLTAAARVTEPQPPPVHPSNDWVAAGTATNAITIPGTNTSASVPTLAGFPELRLQGVFYRPSNPSAVINSKTVYRGDKVDAVRVVAIGKSSVTVEWNGQRKILVIE